MKNSIIRYSLLLMLTCFFALQAQANKPMEEMGTWDKLVIKFHHKKADRHFEGLAYARAIEKYNILLKKGFTPDSVQRNLAISYYKVGKTKKSEEIFAYLVATDQREPLDLYYYAQSLKYNEKYQEADQWIAMYKELREEDSRSILQFKAAPVVEEIYSKEIYKVEPVWFNSKYADFGAVEQDGMIVFASGRNDQAIIQYEYSWKGAPYLDLYETPAEKKIVGKGPRIITKGINSRFHDGPASYSSDGQELFLTRNKFKMGMPKYSTADENHFMIYYAKKEGEKWSELVELPFNSTEYSCGHPVLSNDGSRLYFASDMPGGYGESDIYFIERKDGKWGEPVNLGKDINTEGDEMFPYIDDEGLIYFSSNGHLGLGGLDVFMAKKKGNGYQVVNMGHPLNSSKDDFSFYLKEDGVNGYFASNREGGQGDDDIYQFVMLEKFSFDIILDGIVKDAETKDILPASEIVLVDGEGNEIAKLMSNAEGKFTSTLKPESRYQINANKEQYEAQMYTLANVSELEKDGKVHVELLLDPVKEWGVFGFIYEKESGKGVEGVQAVITEKGNPTPITELTDSEGNFRKLLKPETEYDILLTKEEYFTRRGSFSTVGMEPGWIDVKEFMEVEMEVIEVGKTIEIPNIYYDLAKWNIRPDAAVELDKVVQFMLDNPSIEIELGSHTDARGSSKSNQSLSQKRAQSAVDYIVKNGISKNRITAKGYGEFKLKNKCADGVKCSEDEHQANRRTEIRIIKF